jgi:hypothetical protein
MTQYTTTQFWLSVIFSILLGYFGHAIMLRIGGARRLAHAERLEEETRRILHGLRGWAGNTKPRNPYNLFGENVSRSSYVPRHAAERYTDQAVRALTESTAEAPTILPTRVPGATLDLMPPPAIPVAEVFSE